MQLMYDATNELEPNIPLAAQVVGGYIDGKYKWSDAQWNKRPNAKQVKISAFTPDPNATLYDCESGDFTPQGVANAAHKRHDIGAIPGIYCNLSTWPKVIPLVSDIPVDWVIANPGPPHLLPGTVGTQWGFDGIYDRSWVIDGWPRGKDSPLPVNAPCVAMKVTKSGKGYWLVGADGGVFTYGDAPFFGSMGGKALNAPIIGIEVTPTEQGYFLYAHDYGVFTFGDAVYLGHPQ